MDKVLEVINLTKIFSKTNRGIQDINISVNSGDFHAFIGENGAGKTTTIKSIIGAYPNYSGQILIYGKDIKDASAKSIIGYVPENAIFPKELSVYQYLYNFSILSNIPKKQADTKIKQFLKLFNIEDLINDKPYNFSSGQKKKVLLIQALLHDPKLLILDEPAANLDPTARYELFSLLKNLNENEGITILISSHVLSEIDKYVNSVTLIHNGHIVYSGSKKGHLETLFYEKVINS
ncbi:ABC transporter ATP-binding protein [Mycoplasma bovis]|uniref:ABC transporter, ATP-binding protein n=1 Tax=Mycoplasmopsis bovis (strain ATCC 25523 / DSM 22781 / NCTC 10131 / PG45) TaxID=289397 RepID=A0A454AQG4_MYCBG|nr:ABC transporter ATP-binding protein [Mycoplasmopsis bovis]ADR25301.1 ABC transporter, ATP-binding protein [Mycoplasmopsis bovis PG45]MBT1323048.1 ABC transporter ATP-binding protein [Mycoplasmopsis bovis]MBT1368622.1 ABC transporter ATP-binding protein [Mycoplasmopsis bovis]QLI76150.1 ABC transporter ATP-binding protein [Mycoplasmopsis bovis]TKA60309.1 ABC transporter, ATP-binding protein [Mycoplasmopsis bovis 1067]